ncbi:hypothetical protein [uncultured Sphingomonas sp.]|uniref:hypothetical protein n=1 Tax=uncultured Sphingomonas sp. TaxID=158754 RepID=UPI0035CB309A
MADEHPTIGDLTYELLKKMRAEQQDMHADIMELKMRATSVDEHLSGVMISLSGLNSRVDRLDERLKRVERRLDLTDVG